MAGQRLERLGGVAGVVDLDRRWSWRVAAQATTTKRPITPGQHGADDDVDALVA